MSATTETAASSSEPAILELKGVTKHFGSFVAVDNLDLSIQKGEIFGFLGPNGAGKSTTIRMILDATRPSAGSISIFGQSNRRTASSHQRMGYLSGELVIDEDLTGRQYLDFVESLFRGDEKEFTRYRTHLVYELELNVDTKISRYSRGNKQKVGLVAALMHTPDLLILDEPSSGLDPLMQDVFIRLIQEYRQDGGTVFISSHSLDEVQKLCDRVAFIRSGKLAGVANIEELGRTAAKKIHVSAAKEVLIELGRQAASLPGLSATGRKDSEVIYSYSGDTQALLQLLAKFKLDGLTIREPELEEVFMSYYQTQDRPAEEEEQQ
jgi:ABC-2 type transport system ATP-binding protein